MKFQKCVSCNHKFCEFCHNADKFQKNENKITNFERIKAMSVEEMAEFLANYVQNTVDKYPYQWKQWLESEVDE